MNPEPDSVYFVQQQPGVSECQECLHLRAELVYRRVLPHSDTWLGLAGEGARSFDRISPYLEILLVAGFRDNRIACFTCFNISTMQQAAIRPFVKQSYSAVKLDTDSVRSTTVACNKKSDGVAWWLRISYVHTTHHHTTHHTPHWATSTSQLGSSRLGEQYKTEDREYSGLWLFSHLRGRLRDRFSSAE